ncbi:MAG: hypothetical protein IJS08_18640 [Victivallales bacterium]|nr:hypothetical protein [Victivallales bacterium]
MTDGKNTTESNADLNESLDTQMVEGANATPDTSETAVVDSDEKSNPQNVDEADKTDESTEKTTSIGDADAENTDGEDTQPEKPQPVPMVEESSQCGKEVLDKLQGVESTVAKGQELADANREAILAAVADVKNELLKKVSALKGSADMLLSGQKEINREFREASETAVLNAILGIYREMAKAVVRAQENPDTALEEVGYCQQLVEDALFNLGIIKYEPQVGVDSYDARSGKQKLLSIVPTGDESLNQKIAEVVYPGFLRDDRGFSDLGKAWVKVYRFDPKLVEEQKSEE